MLIANAAMFRKTNCCHLESHHVEVISSCLSQEGEERQVLCLDNRGIPWRAESAENLFARQHTCLALIQLMLTSISEGPDPTCCLQAWLIHVQDGAQARLQKWSRMQGLGLLHMQATSRGAMKASL